LVGYLARDDSNGKIYYIYGGKKYWITTPAAYLEYGFRTIGPNRWTTAPADLALPDGYDLNGDVPLPPLLLANGSLMGEAGGTAIYFVANGVKYHIANPTVFSNYGFSYTDVKWCPAGHLALYTTGAELSGAALPWP